MPDSLKVIYTPHPSLPSNFPGEIPIIGWGKVVLHPGVEEELALKLCKLVLKQLPSMVRLADSKDWVHLGEGFEHLDPNAKKAEEAETTPEPAPEAPPEEAAENDSSESAPSSVKSKKTKKAGDA